METINDLLRYCTAINLVSEQLKNGIEKTKIFCSERNISITYKLKVSLEDKKFGVVFVFETDEDTKQVMDFVNSYFIDKCDFGCMYILKKTINYFKQL